MFLCLNIPFSNSQFDMGDVLTGTETTGDYTELLAYAYHLDSGDICLFLQIWCYACTAREMMVVGMENLGSGLMRLKITELREWGKFASSSFSSVGECGLVTTHANNCNCSSVTDCPVQMENRQLNVAVYPPCPVSHLKLVVNYLNCHPSRNGNFV